jgi:hypothetical protein
VFFTAMQLRIMRGVFFSPHIVGTRSPELAMFFFSSRGIEMAKISSGKVSTSLSPLVTRCPFSIDPKERGFSTALYQENKELFVVGVRGVKLSQCHLLDRDTGSETIRTDYRTAFYPQN